MRWRSHGAPESAVAYSSLDNGVCCSSASSSEGEVENFLDNGFSLNYCVGSGGASRHQDPPNSRVIQIEDLNSCFAQPSPHMEGSVGVVETFGGESEEGKFCIRRWFVRGRNFGLETGFDLTTMEHQ